MSTLVSNLLIAVKWNAVSNFEVATSATQHLKSESNYTRIESTNQFTEKISDWYASGYSIDNNNFLGMKLQFDWKAIWYKRGVKRFPSLDLLLTLISDEKKIAPPFWIK